MRARALAGKGKGCYRWRMKRMLPLLAVLALAGCSTGVVPAGPQTHMVSTSAAGLVSAGVPMAKAYREAHAWCASRGLVMVPVTVQTADAVYGRHMAHCDLTFLAVRPGDPRIGRTQMQRTQQVEPTIVNAPTIYQAPAYRPATMPQSYRVRSDGMGNATVTPTMGF